MVSKKDEEEAGAETEVRAGAWQTERWYGTKYRVRPLPEHRLRQLDTLSAPPGAAAGREGEEGDRKKQHQQPPSPPLSLPGPNPFIPSEFGLRFEMETGEKDHRVLLPANVPPVALETVPVEDWSRLVPPTLVAGTVADGGKPLSTVNVWHKMDRSHRVPRSSIAAKLWTPEPYGSPQAVMMSRMFVRLLKEDLKTWAYDAALADLRYSLEMTTHGLQLSVGGFSSKVCMFSSLL